MTSNNIPQRAWHAVRTQLDVCRRQLRTCADAEDRFAADGHPESEEDLRTALDWLAVLLRDAHVRLLLLFDLAGTPTVLTEYRQGFAHHAGNLDKIERTDFDPELFESLPLAYISRTFQNLAASLEDEKPRSSIDAVGIVEGIMKSAPHIVQRAGSVPTCESDIQRILFDYLRIVFPSAREQVGVGHVVKTFKADIGIDELGVMIEIKFAGSPSEIKAGIGGFFEDMHGYRGDPKWKHFYGFLYTTEPFLTPAELDAEFALSEAPIDWTPIVIHGPGERTRKPATPRLAGVAESQGVAAGPLSPKPCSGSKRRA